MADFPERESLENPPVFNLKELFTRGPERYRTYMDNVIRSYNNRQKTNDTKINNPNYYRNYNDLPQLQEIVDHLDGYNGLDTRRYFHPDTKVRAQAARENEWGSVSYSVQDRAKTGQTIDLNSYLWPEASLGRKIDTLLHEASHVDDNQRKDTKVGLFGEVPAFSYSEFLKNAPKEVLDKYFSSANSHDSDNERRANLRSSLGGQPYGTSEQHHFGPLLTSAEKNSNAVTYYPTQATNTMNGVSLRGKDEILRGLMNDLFPRERWIEERPPTKMEQLSDMFNKYFRRK